MVKVAQVQREVVVDKVDRVLTVRVIKVARDSEDQEGLVDQQAISHP